MIHTYGGKKEYIKSAYHAALRCWALAQNTVKKKKKKKWFNCTYTLYVALTFEREDNYRIQLRNSLRQRNHLFPNKLPRFILIIFRWSLPIQNDWHWRLCTGPPAKQGLTHFKGLLHSIWLDFIIYWQLQIFRIKKGTFLLEPLQADSLAFWSEEEPDGRCWAASSACCRRKKHTFLKLKLTELHFN